MTLDEAEAAERAAFKAIGVLGACELTAVKAWISSNCEGPRPQPDHEARRALTDRLMAAVATREAAERAAGGRGGADGPKSTGWRDRRYGPALWRSEQRRWRA